MGPVKSYVDPMSLNPNTRFTAVSSTQKTQDSELDLIADCLECLRETADLRAGITTETRLELEESLALAEAALRRAHLETKFQ